MSVPVDRHAMLHAIFLQMDADGSDYVDKEEFKSIFSTSARSMPRRGLQRSTMSRGVVSRTVS